MWFGEGEKARTVLEGEELFVSGRATERFEDRVSERSMLRCRWQLPGLPKGRMVGTTRSFDRREGV